MWDGDGIYNPGPINPIVKIKENLAVWTQGAWDFFRVEFIEPMPLSSPLMVEMVVASGVTSLAAGGTIAKRVVAILQLNELDFLHLRWEPKDNVEGVLWEQAGTSRFGSRGAHARVDRNTRTYDPYLASTTFWILGRDRDMQLEIRNPMSYATPVARVQFWGYRYVLTHLASSPAAKQGTLEIIRKELGAVTFVPAEGRAS